MDPLVLSIIVLGVILSLFILVIVSEIRKKRSGKCSCYGCSGCPMKGKCPSGEKNEKK